MNVTVLGAGSWETTVATITGKRNPTTLWARDPQVAREIDEGQSNAPYREGFVPRDPSFDVRHRGGGFWGRCPVVGSRPTGSVRSSSRPRRSFGRESRW